jgi:hypothetical protein
MSFTARSVLHAPQRTEDEADIQLVLDTIRAERADAWACCAVASASSSGTAQPAQRRKPAVEQPCHPFRFGGGR